MGMWSSRRRSARREEIRRAKAERRGVWYQRLPAELVGWSTFVTLWTATGVVFALNYRAEELPLRPGQTLARPVVARTNIAIPDQALTIELQVREADKAPNYFRLDESLLGLIEQRLTSAVTLAKAHPEDTARLIQQAAENKLVLDEAAIQELRRLAEQPDSSEYVRIVKALTARLRTRPLVDPDAGGVRTTPATAVLFDPGLSQERTIPATQLRFTTDEDAVRRLLDDTVAIAPEPLRASLRASLAKLMRVSDAPDARTRPLFVFDSESTRKAALAAKEAVPLQFVRYSIGDVIADAGVLTPDELRRLHAEQAAYLAEHAGAGWLGRVDSIGRGILGLIVVIGVVGYMWRFQRYVYTHTLRWTVSSIAVLMLLLLARLAFTHFQAPPAIGIGAQAFGAALLSVVFPHGAVFAICGGLAVLVAMAMQQGVAYLITLIAVSSIFAFTLRQVRNRGKIVLIGVAAAVTAMICTLATGALAGETLSYLLRQAVWAAAATLIAAFVIEGILPGIERAFRFSTGMTLLEWCDANKPLLRLMAAEAPGTYNHSMLVGTLAGAAADAVGANGLLARVGGYYHDVGKINKPDYFVENQVAGVSRHQRLSPAMSLLIIIGHVKDGLEMAEEYSLPASLRPFIAEHHGTTLVEYFYHVANKTRRPDEAEVPETEFRYPGPKPQSRETAILMICDAVEGAVRAMSEPTPGRIETVVSEIIRKRLVDGQFDECDLTFRELATVEKSVVKSLCGIYHARIRYPEEPREEPERIPSPRHAS